METIPVSAFDRLGRGARQPGRTRRPEPPPRDEPQHSRPPLEEEEAESNSRHMGLTGDEKCLLFFQILRGRAAEWFHNLPTGEIDFFDELAEKDEVDKVEEMDDKTAMSLLVSRLRSGELYKEFCRRPPQSYQEAYNTAYNTTWDYADAEAQVSSKSEAEQGHPRGRTTIKKEVELPGRVKAEMMEVKPGKTEKKPAGEKQWTEKYCSFHKTDSHNTAECNSVKGVIKQMIEAGKLDQEYLAQTKQKKNQWIQPEGQPADQNKKKKAAGKEHLQMIYGGPEGGDSACHRKKWGRELYVGTVALNPRQKQTRREPITFTDRDLPATGEDHNDPLVITMDMGGVDVSRVLIDMGSSVNILYLEAFEKLKLCRTRLEPLKTPLSGPGGLGQVRGDQKKSRSCYLEAVKKMMKAFERVTLVSQEEDWSKLEPGDETEQSVLREAFLEKMERIGQDLPEGLREEIILVLREYADIFAWSVADMSGINRSILCHWLVVMEGSRPIKQQKRHLANVRREFVKNEFKIDYKPRTAIKGQALADFLVELTGLEPKAGPSHTVKPWWDMVVDGASRPKGCGAGIVFTTPEGFKVFHALVFNFKLTNNEGEYEALAGGLRLARALGIKRRKIRSDSSLVVGQVNGEMEVKEERLSRYSDLVRALLRELEEFCLTRIPRSENNDADLLSKLMQACLEHVSKLAKIEILDEPSADRLEVVAVQQAYLASFGIKHNKVSIAYPQGNGQVENANQTVVDGLTKRLGEEGRKWLEALPHTVLAHRVTSRRAMGETPFVLTYGCEARLPIEAEFPTFREAVYQPGRNVADHMAELNLVEERRMMTAVKMAGYQQSVKRYHDNRVGPRYFQVHKEVLRRRDASKPNERGKLVRN
ncbi:unnamed protein product [Cuscuta campestris]|uniref:RNase H type-1 domain-containing protein n=1 Tax=Cuscuta campestris TaxID=132261 RepID=A0A484LED3_9ASTE|nr:unnamed protein product [Cuscuta campestris]